MGSSRPTDRSLGEATFLPQWMKGKLETRFDYTDSTFSPPADDTFFHIRYPGYQDNNASSSTTTTITTAATANLKTDTASATGGVSKDGSLTCQAYTPFSADKVNEPKIIVANNLKAKTLTTDDEFRNAKTAECGRSIVHVASQIMSSTFGKSTNITASQQQGNESAVQQQQQRKVSKSLPATPLTSPSGTPDSSPKARRRVYGNRFFTGVFVPDNGNNTTERKNGWLLSSILGQSRELMAPKIVEEEDEHTSAEQVPARALIRKKSISSQNLTYLGKDEKPSVLQARPSELREMNFWSPTSM